MKFKSQTCTSREQSERLLSLGLKKETADMVHTFLNQWDGYHIHDHDWSDIDCDSRHIPAWSLHRLIEIMPSLIRDDEDFLYHQSISRNGVSYESRIHEICQYYGENLFDCISDCIEWLIKEGHFNKEYLVNQNEIEERCKGVLEYLDYINGDDE